MGDFTLSSSPFGVMSANFEGSSCLGEGPIHCMSAGSWSGRPFVAKCPLIA